MEAKEYVQRLKDISLKKLALFDEILLFNQSQNEVIKEQRFEEMDQLLNERQKRMDAVDKLDEQFMVYSSRLKDVLAISSLEELPQYNLPGTAELKEIIGTIQQKLNLLKKLDDENTTIVKSELKDTREMISNTNAHKRVTGAYYPTGNATSHYFDKKK